MHTIRFISKNEDKIKEVKGILEKSGLIKVIAVEEEIEELQTEDTERLVKDKVLKAFNKIGRPLFVEHTGIYLNYMNQLPGGLTQIFWDKLQADKFAELFGTTSDTRVLAKTVIAYVDGKQFKMFTGEIAGKISEIPLGNRAFQWDCVFIPDGEILSFAELGDKKNEISMRRKALDDFSDFLINKA